MKKEDKLTLGVWEIYKTQFFVFVAFLFFMYLMYKTPHIKKVSFEIHYGIF